MDYYISFKKAATYLEDREGVRRVENLYCYKRCFASVHVPDSADDGNDEEVYVSGFCRIDEDYANEFHGIVDDTDDIESDPIVQIISGKINGKPIKKDDCRLFVLKDRIYKNDVYVKQSELDEVSKYFGIPKSQIFKKEYITTINRIDKEFDPTVSFIFYPDEEELLELEAFYNLSKNSSYSDKVHGNTLHNSKYREEVLGAALAILMCNPKAGRSKSGKFQATALREIIDQQASRFWENGVPPLEPRPIEDLLREWKNLLPDSPELLSTPPKTPAPFKGKNINI